MNLIEWTKMWDDKIKEWSSNPDLYFKNDNIYKAYKSLDVNSELIKNAIPEPYIGDVNSKCSAVVLSLNPGQLLMEDQQVLPDGEFIKDGAAENFSEWAKKWFYLTYEKDTFWKNRKAWLDRRVSDKNKELYPFGIELIPYHSKAWGKLDSNETVLEYVENNVLVVAEEMTKQCVLKFVFCFGKPYYNMFKNLKYEEILKIDNNNYQEFTKEWPVENGRLINRTYIIWKSPRDKFYLQTYAPGGFKAPKEEFIGIENAIMQEIQKRYGCTLEGENI
ncbi:hypothetical protein K2F43_19460 [Clostridium estertheticum]|uniref:hypothetical protein n=1 Tax=Clostridium estertheticum TaxID=238834 RepID=UPI001C6F1027|nr:hypothetical protein [Clostridium estertheticum]MBW9173370.1 hypothetical protein [Clostridium estertheticum]WLC73371.1 hypothetical protein KTC99_11125 [Clostridium estertheticum]